MKVHLPEACSDPTSLVEGKHRWNGANVRRRTTVTVCTGCLRARASVTIGGNANTASRATATEGFSGDGGLQAYGVRWISSIGGWKWAEKWVGVL